MARGPARPQWLAVLIPYGVIASGIASGEEQGGGEEWRPMGYESSYVEAAITITFLTLALAFENVWHRLQNHVNKSHHPLNTAPEDLFKDLMDRAGVEFMTLGFLAFCIFLFNTCGGFTWCVNTIHDTGMSLPPTEGEWVHLAEVVHMQLFLGMIIYFAVISRTVRGAVAKLRHWEQLQALSGGMVAGPELATLRAGKDLQEYSRWLSYFNSHMIRRSQENPVEFADLFGELDIDASDVDYVEKLQSSLVEKFSLQRYLALNVSAGIRDSIQIHSKTWLLMIALFVLFGVLHRYAHWTLNDLVPAFVVAAVMIVIVMYAVVRRKQLSLHRRTQQPNEDSADVRIEFARARKSTNLKKKQRLHEKYNTEIIVLRVLQVMLFLISYNLARDLIDVEEWQSDPIRSLCYALALSATLLLLAHWLPKSLPLFLSLMSMPPYVDDDNFRHFADVLLQCTQESEAKLVRSLTSKHRDLLQDSPHALATAHSKTHAKDSSSRSDMSERAIRADSEDSKLITRHDNKCPSKKNDNEFSDLFAP